MENKTLIVISRHPGRQKKTFEDKLVKLLSGIDGAELLLIPHLYYLKNNFAIYERLLGSGGEILFASWLYKRAAEWALKKEINSRNEPAIIHLSLAEFKTPASAAGALKKALKTAVKGKTRIVDLSKTPVVERWYPVIDHARCNNCGECLEFCLFGVFSRNRKKVSVEDPGKCKPGCPACSRVCPKGAIIFPHYFDDKNICGAD